MLRSFVILLIVLNVLLFGWGQGWMPWLGTLPGDAGRDLRRVERQQFPERLALVPDASAPRASSASVPVATASSSAVQVAAASTPAATPPVTSSPVASAPGASEPGGSVVMADAGSPGATPGQNDRPKDTAATTPAQAAGPDIGLGAGARSSEPVCLELAYVAANESKDLEAALSRSLKRGDWNLQAATQPSTWIVYMGPYEAPDEADRKSVELRRMGVAFEEIRNPAALMPGLSLGRFTDAARAGERLAEAQRKGVRTARVIEALPGRSVFLLRLPKADARVQTVLAELQQGQLKGRRFRPCVSPS